MSKRCMRPTLLPCWYTYETTVMLCTGIRVSPWCASQPASKWKTSLLARRQLVSGRRRPSQTGPGDSDPGECLACAAVTAAAACTAARASLALREFVSLSAVGNAPNPSASRHVTVRVRLGHWQRRTGNRCQPPVPVAAGQVPSLNSVRLRPRGGMMRLYRKATRMPAHFTVTADSDRTFGWTCSEPRLGLPGPYLLPTVTLRLTYQCVRYHGHVTVSLPVTQ
jgi:hypothetical protein